jgi:hypothetical protein
MSKQVADDLRAARAAIAAPGLWCKNAYKDGGRCCAIGALEVLGEAAFKRARQALRHALPEGFLSVVAYNDHPTTTHADILALFDRAIEAEERAGD